MYCKCKKPAPLGVTRLFSVTYSRCDGCDKPIKGSNKYIEATGHAPKGPRPKGPAVQAEQPKLL